MTLSPNDSHHDAQRIIKRCLWAECHIFIVLCWISYAQYRGVILKGATTLSITTNKKRHCEYWQSTLMPSIVMLSVTIKSIMLSVIKLRVVMLNVVALLRRPQWYQRICFQRILKLYSFLYFCIDSSGSQIPLKYL